MSGPADSLELTERDGGVLLPVQARPGSRRTGLLGHHNGRLRVGVSAAPDKGKANEELLRLLAETLGLKRPQIELVSGAASRQKLFRIQGVPLPQLRDRITSVLGTAAIDPTGGDAE